ncbi:MAG TPA: DUF2911 domain-containing protein [Vicinamibacterales bacterium]|nr:DUF2911 domain-containing protein [Vicinamibacterales bacterium]
MKARLIALATLLSACAGSGPLPRPPAPFAGDSAGFVTTLGADTTALELFTIRGNTLEAEVVSPTPRTSVRRVRMSWDNDGRINSYETRVRGPEAHRDSARAVRTWSVASDSITVTNVSGTRTQTSRMANSNVATVLSLPAYSTLAVLARHALARGDTLVYAQFGGDPLPFTVRMDSPATYSFTAPQLGTILIQLDAVGRVHQLDARRSTLGALVRRVATVNLPAWISDYAARDAAGTGLGPLSPPDSVRATVGGANVSINYQRPSKRGRVIFGGVVPWDAVWRTGANTATSFSTDRNLTIGGVSVPAGSYTLWSIPGRTGWQLVINKQTGQWGTVYNQDQDLARISMTVERLASPVEQFTIAIANGRLSLAWDDTRASVPIAIAP